MHINISICPTSLDMTGDLLCPYAVEKAYREACKKFAPDATVDFQVAFRQRGHDEFVVDGRGFRGDDNEDEALFAANELHEQVVDEIDWADEKLYQQEDDNESTLPGNTDKVTP